MDKIERFLEHGKRKQLWAATLADLFVFFSGSVCQRMKSPGLAGGWLIKMLLGDFAFWLEQCFAGVPFA